MVVAVSWDTRGQERDGGMGIGWEVVDEAWEKQMEQAILLRVLETLTRIINDYGARRTPPDW